MDFFLLSGEESVLADFYDSKSICQGYSRSPGDIRRTKLKNKLWLDYNGRGENPFLMFEGHPGVEIEFLWDANIANFESYLKIRPKI